MSLDFEKALEDYVTEHVRIERLARAVLRNKPLQRFLRAAPSVTEVATLNKLAALEAEREHGRARWSPIIVDLDATGHALMLLDLPRVMDGLIGDGPMRQIVDGFTRLLSDPARTAVALVTVPDELPVQETIELHHALARRDVAAGPLFVNAVPSLPLSADQASGLGALAAASGKLGDERSLADIELGTRAVLEHEAARRRIERLGREIDRDCCELPRLPEIDLGALRILGRLACGGA
jgi:anion-transporting  ArsA/GET3 family ATPase